MNDENKSSTSDMDFGNPKNESILWIKSRIKLMANPRFFGALLLVCLVAWASLATRQVRALQEQRALSNERVKLIQAQQDLLIPSEVLYYDWNIMSEPLAEARLESYASLGLESYLPYRNLRTSGYGSGLSSGNEIPTNMGEYSNSHLEHWWLNRVPQLCRYLAESIDKEQGLGLYLKQHPEEFNLYLRPLLIRLLDSYHYHICVTACDVLLAMGDRSDELLEILQLSAINRYSSAMETPKIIEKYGLDLELEKKTSYEQYEAAWKRTHEIVKELKKKYPIQYNTVIQDWDGFCSEGKLDLQFPQR